MRSGRRCSRRPLIHGSNHPQDHQADRSDRAAESGEPARAARDARQEAAEASAEGARAGSGCASRSGTRPDRAGGRGASQAERASSQAAQGGRATHRVHGDGPTWRNVAIGVATIDAATIDAATRDATTFGVAIVDATAVAAAHRAVAGSDPCPSSRESGRSAPVEAHERAGPVLAARSRRVDRERLGEGRRHGRHDARRAGVAARAHRHRSGGRAPSERAGDDPAQQADGLRLGPGRGRPSAGDRADQAGEPLGRRSVADAIQGEPPARARPGGAARHRLDRAARVHAGRPRGQAADRPRLGGREGIPGARRGHACPTPG